MSQQVFQKSTTFLHYPLNTKHHVVYCYLIPLSFSCLVYILHFSADTVLSIQHYQKGDKYHALLTLLWVFVPILGSFFLTVTNLELWPNEEKCGKLSWKWLGIRFLQHLLFPLWAMLRYAEQLFWSIEAFRANDEENRQKCLKKVQRRSVFELYLFLQAYFQAVPQILFQMHIILRHPSNFNKSTVDMQVMSIVLCLIKVSIITTSYQRYYSQKFTGRQYPWDKVKEKELKSQLKSEQQKQLLKKNETSEPKRKDSGLSTTSSQFDDLFAKRNSVPIRIDSKYGLIDDDVGGKFVAMIWWFCFLLPRILCIPIFSYFYIREAVIMFVLQYFLYLVLLLYFTNAKTITVHKTVFMLIISFIYLFCLIEFKIKFMKVKVVYYCYFIFIYLQNATMVYLWYFHIEEINGFWYDYVLYLVIISSILSVLSMAFYLHMLKPQEIVVAKIYRHSQL